MVKPTPLQTMVEAAAGVAVSSSRICLPVKFKSPEESRPMAAMVATRRPWLVRAAAREVAIYIADPDVSLDRSFVDGGEREESIPGACQAGAGMMGTKAQGMSVNCVPEPSSCVLLIAGIGLVADIPDESRQGGIKRRGPNQQFSDDSADPTPRCEPWKGDRGSAASGRRGLKSPW